MAIERLTFEGPDAVYHAYHASQHLVRYAAVRSLCAGRRVLDVACGQGYGCTLLVEWGASEVVGIDVSEEAIAAANKFFAHERIRYVVGNAENLELLLDGQPPFDLVVSFETIEHVSHPEKFLSGIKRCVTATGAIVISCPNDRAALAEGETNQFHLATYSFAEFRGLAESVLGPASHWLVGIPLLGQFNYIPGSKTVEDEHPDATSMLDFEPVPDCLLLPSQSNLRSSPNTGAHYIGVWGATIAANAVISGMSVPRYLEPWHAIDDLRNQLARLQQSNAHAEQQKEALSHRVAEQEKQTAELMAQQNALRAQLETSDQRRAELQAELDGIKGSRWYRAWKRYRALYHIPLLGPILRFVRRLLTAPAA